MFSDASYSELEWGGAIELPSSRALRSTTHIIGGRYPCRSIALIPRMILSEMNAHKNGVNVLDPFMGSGTTAVEAALKGFTAYGLEVDPYARLIGNLSTHSFKNNELSRLTEIKDKIIGRFASCHGNEKYSPQMKGIDYWFSKQNYNALLKLKTLIHTYTKDSDHLRDFFLTVLADIVRASSKAERQSLKPYISTRYIKKNISVLPIFEKAFDSYFAAMENAASQFKGGKIKWIRGDATNFLIDQKMDVAITSPPYINAMDYVRCIKLESAWVGTGDDSIFSNVRSAQVGETARSKFKTIGDVVRKTATPYLKYLEKIDAPRYRTAMAYFQDMHDNLVCVRKALKKGGSYHLIVGNSAIRNNYVPTHEIIAKIAEHIGYDWYQYVKYPIKDHRTSLPRNGRGGKISEEHVISLKK